MSAIAPKVLISYAQSIDGKIAMLSGQSQWISGSGTLDFAHELRGRNEVILVGIGTVLSDDPELSCRISDCQSPLRVVLDTSLRLPLDSRLAETAGSYETVVYTSSEVHNSERAAELRARSITVREVPLAAGRLSVAAVCEDLGSRGYRSLFVEGGSSVITAFFRAGLVDRLIVVIAPILIGSGIPGVAELGLEAMRESIGLETIRQQQMGPDLVWELSRHE